jgi:hypothetical protein
MRFPRMTTRRWMLAVAVVALLMGGVVVAVRATRRSREYRQIAVWHAAMRDLCLGEAYEYQYAYDHRAAGDHRAETDWPRYEAHERALARHHDGLAAKYDRAARYPWLPVEPDPPEP